MPGRLFTLLPRVNKAKSDYCDNNLRKEFSNVDLRNIEHLKWTDSAIEFKNFLLGNEETF